MQLSHVERNSVSPVSVWIRKACFPLHLQYDYVKCINKQSTSRIAPLINLKLFGSIQDCIDLLISWNFQRGFLSWLGVHGHIPKCNSLTSDNCFSNLEIEAMILGIHRSTNWGPHIAGHVNPRRFLCVCRLKLSWSRDSEALTGVKQMTLAFYYEIKVGRVCGRLIAHTRSEPYSVDFREHVFMYLSYAQNCSACI
jgi:hypothetical protein